MTLGQFLINIVLGLLAFFVVRYVASLIAPTGRDSDKIINIIALLVGIVVFFANFAAQFVK